MQDEAKTKEQLIIELHELRERVAESEKDQADYKRGVDLLRHRSEELQLILDTVPATIWFKDKSNNFLRVNKAACEMLGIPVAEIDGKHASEVFPDWLAEKYYQDDLEVINSRRPKMGIEEQLTNSAGELRWVCTDKIPWFDGQGDLAGVLAFAVDITKRKLAEDALQESEDKYRRLAESIPGMVFQFVLQKDGSFSLPYVNERIMQYAGIAPEAAMAEPSLLFTPIHPDDQEMIQQAISISARTLHNFVVEHRLIDVNGLLRWFRVESMPQPLSNGDILWNGVSIDITDQKRAEDALRESEERYRQVVENVNEAIIVAQDGKLKFVNCVASEIFGYPEGELLSRPFLDFIHRDDRSMVMDRHLRRLRGETLPARYPFRLVGKDGGTRWVQIGAALIEWEGRAATLNLLTDITDRKQAEEERVRLEAENRQLQKAESLGRMAGAIAHLFNNRLSVVIGNLELALMDLSVDAVIRKNLIEAMRAARRSAEISGLMLIYLGQSTDKGELLDLADVCRHNLPMLQDVMPEGIALETDLPSSGPVVRAHANQIQQVLTHLITNGWESIGHSAGKVTLATRIIPASEIPKSHLAPVDWKPAADLVSCLEVTDTGRGIAEEDLDKIFDPFFTTKFTGRGLGLAVVLGIVKTLGGAIGVEIKQNQGSIFRVFLPLVTDALPRASEKATEVHRMEQGGTVLLVEDQDTVRKMAELMLKRLGYEVLVASGGAEAVELLRENPEQVQFVITDLTMPGMDGWETLMALRKIRPHIPVVLVSGHDEAHAMGRDYPERPHVFLHKPYLKGELESAIDTALKKPVSTK
jgi:PAS domain S-box-containing protein